MQKIYYKEPVFRPPSEARSLLIQATEGCTHSCSFCVGNLGKKFLIRNTEDIKKDISTAKNIYGNTVRKMFLLDGNAFAMPAQSLIEVAEHAYQEHSALTRIGAYSHAEDILNKTDEELKAIYDSGIKILYLGIESGNNNVLKQIGKKITSEKIAEACHKLYKSGITLSATIIFGLVGNDPEQSTNHAIKTAELIKNIQPSPATPWYLSALNLMIAPGSRIYNQVQRNEFQPANGEEILKEFRTFFANLDDSLEKCIFRSNHASNYLPLESNNLARDRKKLLENIDYVLENKSLIKSENLRGL